MNRLVTATLLSLSLMVVAGEIDSYAQSTFALGPRVGYELDNYKAVFAGVGARIGFPDLPIKFNPTLDYYFLDEEDYTGNLSGTGLDVSILFLQLGLNALYDFGLGGQAFAPYIGGGLAVTRATVKAEFSGVSESESESKVGLNLLGGASFGTGSIRPFVQVQATFGDAELISLLGGLLFVL